MRTDPHPGLHISKSLICHVDLDSLWMAPWDNCRTLETGSRPGIYIWRNVMCSVARLSCMPVLPDTGCLRSFRDLGRACVLDLNAGETYTPVWMPGGGFLQSRRFRLVVWWCCHRPRSHRCVVVCGGAVARGMDIPRVGHWLRGKLILPWARGARQNRAFPGRAVPRARGARQNRAFPGRAVPRVRGARKNRAI